MAETAVMKLLVTIVDRGRGSAAVDIYRRHGLCFDYVSIGKGTASSQILDYFGLAETEKDVVLTLVPGSWVKAVIADVNGGLGLKSPGRGILFTLPLTAVSAQVPRVLCPEGEKKEERAVEKQEKYDLILAIVNRGGVDAVMDAARSCGARGGTVLHARRVGLEEGEGLLGFSIQPEKEVIAILTEREQKMAIMRAVNAAAGCATENRGILLSLPVEDMMGLIASEHPGAGQQ